MLFWKMYVVAIVCKVALWVGWWEEKLPPTVPIWCVLKSLMLSYSLVICLTHSVSTTRLWLWLTYEWWCHSTNWSMKNDQTTTINQTQAETPVLWHHQLGYIIYNRDNQCYQPLSINASCSWPNCVVFIQIYHCFHASTNLDQLIN